MGRLARASHLWVKPNETAQGCKVDEILEHVPKITQSGGGQCEVTDRAPATLTSREPAVPSPLAHGRARFHEPRFQVGWP